MATFGWTRCVPVFGYDRFIELCNIKYLQNIHIKIPEISVYYSLP